MQSYHNSAYNYHYQNMNGHLSETTSTTNTFNQQQQQQQQRFNEKKELQEINNRLNIYIKSVRDLIKNRTYSTQSSNIELSTHTANLLNSVKYLENDLEVLKQLYENEIKILNLQVEDLTNENNKCSLDVYNHELKIRDLTQKVGDEKQFKEKLIQELEESKTKNNRIEYDLEKLKIDMEKPYREYNGLKNNYEELQGKFNALQNVADEEKSTRQSLEEKLRESNDELQFLKKSYEQEIENLQQQLDFSRNTIIDFDLKIKNSQQADTNLQNLLDKVKEKADKELEAYKRETKEVYQKNFDLLTEQIKVAQEANEKLKVELQQSEKRNESLQSLCRSLETTIVTIENSKRSVEQELYEHKSKALQNLQDFESKLNDVQQLFVQTYQTKNPPIPLNLEVDTLKELINDEELRLQQLNVSPLKASVTPQSITNYDQFNRSNSSNNIDSGNNYQNNNNNNNSQNDFTNINNNNNNDPSRNQDKYEKYLYSKIQPTPPVGPIGLNGRKIQQVKTSNNSTPQLPEQNYEQINSYLSQADLITTQQQQQQQQSTQERSPTSISRSYRPSPSPQLTTQVPLQVPHPPASAPSGAVRDYTVEMFKTFEKTAFQNKPTQIYNSVDNTILEASYTGNIKIHEVNKNGYYVRLLNVSNTCDEDISNYTIQQMVSSMPVAVYRFPQGLKLPAGQTVTVWARTDEVEEQPPHTFVWYEQKKWGTGPECTTILAKPNGQAVSWTTGCHKIGNIDYDEIASVYSRTQKRTRSAAQLNREKLSPRIVYKYNPSKHPHAQSPQSTVHPALSNTNTTVLPNSEVIQVLPGQRPINSATGLRKAPQAMNSIPTINSPKTSTTPQPSPRLNKAFLSSSSEQNEDSHITYQENLIYFQPKVLFSNE